MEDRYYVRFKGRVLGPMSGDKTTELVRRGQITRVHELSPDGIAWRKAEEFAEFYPKKSVAAQAVAEVVTTQQKPKEAEAAEWYVHMDGQNQGPVEESSIRLWVSSGRVNRDSLVWKDGMDEWLAAELVRPQWFAGRSVASNVSAKVEVGDIESLDAICLELRRQSNWIYLTAIIAMFACGFQILAWLFLLISQIVAPPANGSAVVASLIGTFIGLVFSGIGMVCAVQLLRYANGVSVLKHAPTTQNALAAAKTLSGFWLLVGIYVLVTVLFFTLLGLLIYVGALRSVYTASN